jgi:hypothetical protein
VYVTVAGATVSGPVFTLTAQTILTSSLGYTTTYDAAIVGGYNYDTEGNLTRTDSRPFGVSDFVVAGAHLSHFMTGGAFDLFGF